MEKKRRARINDSLETLKRILLESQSTGWKDAKSRTAKLEKADILEMTVRYLQQMRRKLEARGREEKTRGTNKVKGDVSVMPADSSCERQQIEVALVPTRLRSGQLAFLLTSQPPPPPPPPISDGDLRPNREKVWRPW